MTCSNQGLRRRPRFVSEAARSIARWVAALLSFAEPPPPPVPFLLLLLTALLAAGFGLAGLAADPSRPITPETLPEESEDRADPAQFQIEPGPDADGNWSTSHPVVPQATTATSQDVTEPTRADQKDARAVSGPIDVGDWDWSGVADTDVGPADGRALARRRMQDLAKKPRVGETAEPDFDRPVRPAHALFSEATPFMVIASKKDPDMHPCLDCHDWAKSDLTPRVLKEPHDNFQLRHGLHGKGKFWCFTCHHLEGEGGLHTLDGEKFSFDEAYVICSQCHAREARDWVFGGHGKRVGPWLGSRQVLNCTACHYQHRPRIKARKPMPGPKIRVGLARPAHWVGKDRRPNARGERERIWERYIEGRDGSKP